VNLSKPYSAVMPECPRGRAMAWVSALIDRKVIFKAIRKGAAECLAGPGSWQ
jgi:hypothetical protein